MLDADQNVIEGVEICQDITCQKLAKILEKPHEELKRTLRNVEIAKREWEKTMDCHGERCFSRRNICVTRPEDRPRSITSRI